MRVKFGNNQARGYTHLASGQRMSCWLPAGEYDVLGDMTLADRDGVHRPVVGLCRLKNGEVWYTAPSNVHGGMPAETARNCDAATGC